MLIDHMENIALVNRANADLPPDAEPLQRAEGTARGFPDVGDLDFGDGGGTNDEMRLSHAIIPDWNDVNMTAFPPGRSKFRLRNDGVRFQHFQRVMEACRNFIARKKNGGA